MNREERERLLGEKVTALITARDREGRFLWDVHEECDEIIEQALTVLARTSEEQRLVAQLIKENDFYKWYA